MRTADIGHWAKNLQVLERGYAPLMDLILRWAKDSEAIRALFLAGSIANDTADVYSDLDLVVIADEGAIETLAQSARTVIDAAEPIIMEYRLRPGRVHIRSVVTDQWHRIDIAFGEPDSGIVQQALVPVFDPDALYDGAPAQSAPAPLAAEEVIKVAKEFLRILGLCVVVLGRKDVHAGHDGANLLRSMLIELFLMEPPRRSRPGAKKLLPALTDEHQDVLRTLPPVADDLQAIATFSSAAAAVFLPRARKLTEALGGTWPSAAEQATLAYLHSHGNEW